MRMKKHWLFPVMGVFALMLTSLGGISDEDDDYDFDADAVADLITFAAESLSDAMKADLEAKKWDYWYGSEPLDSKGNDLENTVRYSKIRNYPDEELRKIRRKAFLLKHKKITIGYGIDDLLGLNVNNVCSMLHNQAFTRITKKPVRSIGLGLSDKPGRVKQIQVGKATSFEKTDMFPYDTHIKVYFCNSKIKLPISSKQLEKMHYKEACNYLDELGFVNIRIKAKKNLLLGLLHAEGEIDSISIAGNCDFRKNKSFPYDATVIIEYHSF